MKPVTGYHRGCSSVSRQFSRSRAEFFTLSKTFNPASCLGSSSLSRPIQYSCSRVDANQLTRANETEEADEKVLRAFNQPRRDEAAGKKRERCLSRKLRLATSASQARVSASFTPSVFDCVTLYTGQRIPGYYLRS